MPSSTMVWQPRAGNNNPSFAILISQLPHSLLQQKSPQDRDFIPNYILDTGEKDLASWDVERGCPRSRSERDRTCSKRRSLDSARRRCAL